jgi:hypothetical protein
LRFPLEKSLTQALGVAKLFGKSIIGGTPMTLRIPFTDRCRKYGYIFWFKQDAKEASRFFGDRDSVVVWLNDSLIGTRRIDWKYHRISLGWAKTRSQPSGAVAFRLSFRRDGSLKVVCE